MRPGPADLRCRRRALLEVGFASTLGLSLTRASTLPSNSPRAKSVLLVFLAGACSHIDTFDPKPDAPAEIRGEFTTIATSVPSLRVTEHLPNIATEMHHFCLVRSMSMDRSLGAHDFGTHAILAGIDLPPAGPTRSASRTGWPCFAAGLDALGYKRPGLPTGVHFPKIVQDAGIGVYPGQNAGILGATHDPMQLNDDPSAADFHVRSCSLPPGLVARDLDHRLHLLREVDQQQRHLAQLETAVGMSEQQRRAAKFLADGRLARAFDLTQESDRTRDHYGRHYFGQSLLLGRRLVEAGVPIVQANLSQGQSQWDTHTDNFNGLKNNLLPPFDQALAALMQDFAAKGLLESTLVVVFGEFGRTPKIGGNIGTPFYSPTGRDHWCDCFFALFAGAGTQGGSTVGASDRFGAYPATKAFTPADFGATIYDALGVDPASIVHDTLGRPVRLNAGTPMHEIYTGKTV